MPYPISFSTRSDDLSLKYEHILQLRSSLENILTNITGRKLYATDTFFTKYVGIDSFSALTYHEFD